MSQSLFKVGAGVRIGGASMLAGTGAPGGDTAYEDDALIGSFYMDETAGALYLKKTTGTGTDKWLRVQNQTDLDDALLGQSWREPAQVHDTTAHADLAAAVTAANVADTLDGQTIVADDRVLLTALASGNKNVYIVSGSTGDWTLTEDANLATKGDALYVQTGTSAGQQWAYNGTAWVQQGGGANTEIGFLQTYTGKTADGSETPTYSQNNVVTDGESLETAIGKLDLEIGDGVSASSTRTTGQLSDQNIGSNIEALDAAIGNDVTSIQVCTAAGTANANISLLDAAVGNAATGFETRTKGQISTSDLGTHVENLDEAIGPTPTSTKNISATVSVNENLSTLDTILAEARVTNVRTGVQGSDYVLDSVVVDDFSAAKWILHAFDETTPANVYTSEILGIHNGTAAADATLVDWTVYGELTLGAEIAGLTIAVELDGVGAAQTMRLVGTATGATTIRITREAVNQATS